MIRRFAALVAGAVVMLALAAGAWAAFAPLPAGSRELAFLIPPGTAARVKAGAPFTVLPSPVQLTLGIRDILVLTNDDEVMHQLGPVLLGAPPDLPHPLPKPGAIPVRVFPSRVGDADALHRARATGRPRAPALAAGQLVRGSVQVLRARKVANRLAVLGIPRYNRAPMRLFSRQVVRFGILLLAVRVVMDMAMPHSPGAFRLDPLTSVQAAGAPHQAIAASGTGRSHPGAWGVQSPGTSSISV